MKAKLESLILPSLLGLFFGAIVSADASDANKPAAEFGPDPLENQRKFKHSDIPSMWSTPRAPQQSTTQPNSAQPAGKEATSVPVPEQSKAALEPKSAQPTPAESKAEMEPKDYPDSRGKMVHFPEGDLSFADEIIEFKKGDPSAKEKYSDPKNMLGPPDYRYGVNDNRPVALTLGCGGEVVFRFTNNVLVDVKGPDLYVFEVGEDEEATELSISEDGRKWIDLGKISGATAAVDIGPHVMANEMFHYVRLRDLRSHCEGEYPGADIDAVGAIGSALKLSLQSAVLFDYKEAKIKSEAKTELHKIAQILKQHPDAKLIIEGHTDAIGSDDYNLKLSEERAQFVKDYLVDDEKLTNLKIETKGYGKTRPIATNATEEGREHNRRVEIIVMP